MGIEYAHGIFVADLMWGPERRHVDAACSVLDHAFERETEIPSGELPPNLAISYARPRGPRVATLMGPSAYDGVADDDRYLMSINLVFGVDFKRPFNEAAEPPLALPRNGTAPIPSAPRRWLRHHDVYPASWSTTPPEPSTPGSFWRSGLVLDCGKDVPAFASKGASLPGELVRLLAVAFETALVEYGWFY